MDKLLIKYVDQFGENFPLFTFRGVDEKEIIKLIETALKENKPFKIKYDRNKIY